jgi:hypothetical protein
MSLPRIKNMLTAIDQGQSINLLTFKKMLAQLSLKHRVEPSDIVGDKVKGDQYTVSYFHPQLARELHHLVNDMGTDRNSAARQNRSHKHKVDGSLILVRHLDQHPQVVTIDSVGNFRIPIQQSRTAVVLENRQLFLCVEQFYAFIQDYTDIPCDQPVDFLFGMGNEIANSLHDLFLSAYDHLYLCFDLDLGGLSTARNLYNLIPQQSMSFIQPRDIVKRLGNVSCRRDSDYLEKVAVLGQDSPEFLKPYAQLIHRMGRTIEQESFLNG